MARPNDIYSMAYEDGGLTLDDLLSKIEQVSPTVQAKPSTSVIDSLTQQILGQGTTDKWKGGVDAQTAAKDMAKIMAGIGITDINQFGKVTRQVEEYVGTDDTGTPMYQVRTEETFGNKETGQAVPNTYSERQKGNAWGGTFEGKGNTGYRVDFAPDGTPVFYTTQSSSNDLFNILAQNPILNAAANYFAFQAGGPAGVAALNAAQGKSFEDVAKATLLSYAGGELGKAVSPYLPTPEVPIDFTGGTPEQINDALQNQFVKDLKAAGVTNVSEFINNVGGNAATFTPPEVPQVTEPVVTPTVTPTIENVQVTAPVQPTVTPTIAEVINSIVAQQPVALEPVAQPIQPSIAPPVAPIESVQVTAPIAPTPTINQLVNAIAAQQPVTTQEPVAQPIERVEITGQSERPQETPTIANVISAIDTPMPQLVITGKAETPPQAPPEEPPAIPLIMSPTAPTNVQTEPVKSEKEKEKSWTAAELAELARLGLLATTVLGAAEEGPQRFPIVPIPADWTSPIKPKGSTGVAPTQLPPIDFGNRELLRGTQWEKFLDPNYGQVPAPVQFNQPTNMSYDRLMSILGTGRDVLPSQALTINDVISGIQNQYGQTTNSAMGQKPT